MTFKPMDGKVMRLSKEHEVFYGTVQMILSSIKDKKEMIRLAELLAADCPEMFSFNRIVEATKTISKTMHVLTFTKIPEENAKYSPLVDEPYWDEDYIIYREIGHIESKPIKDRLHKRIVHKVKAVLGRKNVPKHS